MNINKISINNCNYSGCKPSKEMSLKNQPSTEILYKILDCYKDIKDLQAKALVSKYWKVVANDVAGRRYFLPLKNFVVFLEEATTEIQEEGKIELSEKEVILRKKILESLNECTRKISQDNLTPASIKRYSDEFNKFLIERVGKFSDSTLLALISQNVHVQLLKDSINYQRKKVKDKLDFNQVDLKYVEFVNKWIDSKSPGELSNFLNLFDNPDKIKIEIRDELFFDHKSNKITINSNFPLETVEAMFNYLTNGEWKKGF